MTQKAVTFENLASALAGESMAHVKYLYFAKIAEKHGDHATAELFRETAKQELMHATAHLELLHPSADLDVKAVLQMAIDGETYEYTTMYPEFYKAAVREKDEHAQKEFQEQIAESKEHAGVFIKALETASKRFDALTRVEKRHAGQYEARLNQVK